MDDLLSPLKPLVTHPYFVPILLVGLVALFFYLSSSGFGLAQMVGGDQTEAQSSSHSPAPPQASVPPQVDQADQTKEPVTVVLFWADWCGHCQTVKPVWDQLMAKYQAHPAVQLDEINCAQNQEVAERYQIKGFPTIMKFCGQRQPQIYGGDRSPADLEAFINSN